MDIKERTGWRDNELSLRHKYWGNLPATNIDFLLAEYGKNGRSAALIEYKHNLYTNYSDFRSDFNLTVVANLGERASVPAYVVRYDHFYRWWEVTPMTEGAKYFLNGFRNDNPEFGSPRNHEQCQPDRWSMTEQGFVAYLYYLRDDSPIPSFGWGRDGRLITVNGDRIPQRQFKPFDFRDTTIDTLTDPVKLAAYIRKNYTEEGIETLSREMNK